jgi:hypothetical protein
VCRNIIIPARENSTQMTTTERVNLTNLTPHQKHQIVTTNLEQKGFKGYIKEKQNQQIYLIFQYEDFI